MQPFVRHNNPQSIRCWLTSVAVGGILASSATGQCPPQWLPGDGVPGVYGDGVVSATTTWDPDGAGPRPESLIVGGYFRIAGKIVANNIACWDPATHAWSALGSGVGDPSSEGLSALAALGGKLYVGGWFTTAGGVNASNIACWDPATSTWAPLGSGVDAQVHALTVLGGKLYAGGRFTTAGDVSANHIACWDPATSTWMPLGLGTNDTVGALAVMGTSLYAGGEFTTAGGASARRIARWDPATSVWSALASGIGDSSGGVCALAPLGDTLYAGGWFHTAGGLTAENIASWDLTTQTWSPLGAGVSSEVRALASQGGALYVGGRFLNADGASVNGIAAWDPAGSTWSALGSGITEGGEGYGVRALTVMDGKLCAGGYFSVMTGVVASSVACWDPVLADWSALGSGMGGTLPQVNAVAVSGGKLYIGGTFLTAGTAAAKGIARWEPATSTWSLLGSGIEGLSPHSCTAVLALGNLNGRLYAGGCFATAGGASANNIACWDPETSTWTNLGSGTNGEVRAIVALNGKLYAGGRFTTVGGVAASSMACWDPSTSSWSALGSGMGGVTQPNVQALAILNGRLYAGGWFTSAGGVSANRIACWDPEISTWSALGRGMDNAVYALLSLDGKLYAGGSFVTAGDGIANGIACWDPQTSIWSALGSGVSNRGYVATVLALTAIDRKLYVGGGWFSTAGGLSAENIACWDPAAQTWSAMGSGMNDQVQALTVLDGRLYAGGSFTIAGGRVSACFARWGTAPRADFDCDLDVDGDDLEMLEACATGPGVLYKPLQLPLGCTLIPDPQDHIAADFDGDRDVDQVDFGVLQRCYSGADVPQSPECGG